MNQLNDKYEISKADLINVTNSNRMYEINADVTCKHLLYLF